MFEPRLKGGEGPSRVGKSIPGRRPSRTQARGGRVPGLVWGPSRWPVGLERSDRTAERGDEEVRGEPQRPAHRGLVGPWACGSGGSHRGVLTEDGSDFRM